MVDVAADGPIPGDDSMICFGAVIVEPSLSKTFYGRLRPISDRWVPEALAVSGFTRERTLAFPEPASVMGQFRSWRAEHCGGRLMFISDNHGFDWQFINWHFHHLHRGEPVRPFVHQPRLALQGDRPRHDADFQTPAEDPPHAPSRR